MSGGYGPSSLDSFAYYDPDTCSWRTCQGSLFEEWAMFSATWPRAGMTRNGTASERSTSAPPTDAAEFGSWPTPQAADGDGGRNETAALNRAAETGESLRTLNRPSGAKASVSLRTAVEAERRGLWPPPAASDWEGVSKPGQRRGQLEEAVKFPTPTVRDSNTYAKVKRGSSAVPGGTPLVMAVSPDGAAAECGQLNPTWVELLMGYPPGWTEL